MLKPTSITSRVKPTTPPGGWIQISRVIWYSYAVTRLHVLEEDSAVELAVVVSSSSHSSSCVFLALTLQKWTIIFCDIPLYGYT